MTARTVQAECPDPHSMLNLCMVNLSNKPIEFPSGSSIVLASAEMSAGLLPTDATAWLRSAPANSTRQTSRHEAEGGE